jgi:hypothetical protein
VKERSPWKGMGSGAHWRAKTHCPKGHPYDEENTYITSDGKRQCRACRRVHAKKPAKRKTLVPGWRDQECPICGDRWFVNASIHVKKVHGVRLRGLSSEAFRENRRILTAESGQLDVRPKEHTQIYYGRWAKVAREEITAGGFYVERLAKRWRLTRQGASSRLMRLEDKGLIERPRATNRSLRSEKDPRTKCLHGHALTPENTYVRDGIRRCQICLKEQAHAAYERRKARGYYDKS